jgi:hypothetical protein
MKVVGGASWRNKRFRPRQLQLQKCTKAIIFIFSFLSATERRERSSNKIIS